MSAFQIAAVALLGTLVLLFATVFITGPRWAPIVERHRSEIGMAHWRDRRAGHRFQHAWRQHRPCRDNASRANLSLVLDFVARDLSLTGAQQPSWRALRAELEESGTRFEEMCAEFRSERPRTTLVALRQAEATAETGLEALRRIEPLFETFYETLTAEQRARIERYWARRR